MRQHSIPFAFLALLLIISLAGVGVVYGYWHGTLTVEGTVQSGTLAATVAVADGQVEGPKDNGATCTAQIKDNKLQVTVTGAFPGYSCAQPFTITNTGTVPYRLAAPTGKITPSDGVTVEWPSCFDVEQTFKQNDVATCTFKATIGENAKQNKTYEFKYDIIATQHTPAE